MDTVKSPQDCFEQLTQTLNAEVLPKGYVRTNIESAGRLVTNILFSVNGETNVTITRGAVQSDAYEKEDTSFSEDGIYVEVRKVDMREASMSVISRISSFITRTAVTKWYFEQDSYQLLFPNVTNYGSASEDTVRKQFEFIFGTHTDLILPIPKPSYGTLDKLEI